MLAASGCGRDVAPSAAISDRPSDWEYRSVGVNYENLEMMGADGWEAFAIDRDEHGAATMWLRRPLRNRKP